MYKNKRFTFAMTSPSTNFCLRHRMYPVSKAARIAYPRSTMVVMFHTIIPLRNASHAGAGENSQCSGRDQGHVRSLVQQKIWLDQRPYMTRGDKWHQNLNYRDTKLGTMIGELESPPNYYLAMHVAMDGSISLAPRSSSMEKYCWSNLIYENDNMFKFYSFAYAFT